MTIEHLKAHHGDIERFHEAMIQTSVGRFNAVWWGIFDTYATPGDGQVGHVLDLGTGPGLILPHLRDRFPSAQITAVELRDEMLATAREIAEPIGAKVIEADVSKRLPLDDASVDVLTCVMLLHELLFPPATLAEMGRLVRPGGRVIIYDWVKRDLCDYLDEGQELTPDLLNHFREHCLFSANDLEFMAAAAGFKVVETIGRRGGNFAILALEKV